jgi:DNA polymerase III sliding clamp (beta) subunit (PCNA family)
MKIKKSELLAALEAVKPGLADKDTIQQATSFVFIKDKIVTYNDEISIQCPLNGLDVTGAVLSKELYSFLTKTKKEDIEIEQEKTELVFRAGKSKAGFAIQSEIKLPLDEINLEKKFTKLPDNFLEALRFVLFTCSTNSTEPLLNCVNVRSDGIMEACDNHRLTTFTLKGTAIKKTFLIPAASAQSLLKYTVTKININGGWAHFTDDNIVFSCRVINEPFPDTAPLLKNMKSNPVNFPDIFDEVVQRACIFSSEKGVGMIEVKVEKNRIYVLAKSSTAWFEEWVKAENESEVTIKINPNFLLDMLKHVHSGDLTSKQMRFHTEDWLHITSLYF